MAVALLMLSRLIQPVLATGILATLQISAPLRWLPLKAMISASCRPDWSPVMIFDSFDYIIAMDRANLSDLKHMQPADYTGHLGLFLDFSMQTAYTEVPDPYYGGEDGFELVFNLVEEASRGLLQHILANHQLGAGRS